MRERNSLLFFMDNISNSSRKQHKAVGYFTNLWPLLRYLWHKVWMQNEIYFRIYLIYLSISVTQRELPLLNIQVSDHNFIYKLLFILLVASSCINNVLVQNFNIPKGIEPWMSSLQMKYLAKHFFFSTVFSINVHLVTDISIYFSIRS